MRPDSEETKRNIADLNSLLRAMREEAIREGLPLLSDDEVLEEVARRRGGSLNDVQPDDAEGAYLWSEYRWAVLLAWAACAAGLFIFWWGLIDFVRWLW